ncbi:UNVERIFIED_CONTAM: Retrovirus-related Pol polyprotein from transposon TNT 1-94 [Sesamum calycinum]|uniref:Retrovirus-related Pol polyprotein from transposon TNT 1-94 n=1 Tax=Sesamum calycinum TaxID=2727403 RepID=A0AAW2J367_9LAMI
MVEDKSVSEQTYEIINLKHALVDAEMKLPEKFLAIIGRTISIGNSCTAEVLGIGSVDVKFPSKRILSSKRVHHVPTIRRNIISGSMIHLSTSIPEHVEKMKNVGVNTSNSTSLTHEESDEPRRSKRAKVVKDFGSDFVTYNIEDDPVTFKDAMASSEAKQWKEAVKSEMDSIVSNGTWVLVDLPLGCTTMGVLIAWASVYNLSIHQMDVKTTFLYGELEEEIYMDHPEGFIGHGNEHKVCKLVKSLYGLKQAPKQWYEKFDQKLGSP